MACIKMDGWEFLQDLDTPGLWTNVSDILGNGEIEYNSVNPRTLLGSIHITNTSAVGYHYLYDELPSTYTHLYGAFGIFIDSAEAQVEDANDAIPFFSVVASNGVTQLTMAFSVTTNKIKVFRGDVDGGILLATSTVALADDTWEHIQWRYVIDNLAGIVQVKINGVVVINLSSANTKTSGTDIAIVLLGIMGGTGGLYFDDFVINDTTGTVSNSWPGNAVVQLINPNGAGTHVAWTPTTTISADVDDLTAYGTPDDDTTVISSITVNSRASVNLQNPSVNGPINAIMLITYAKNDEPGDDEMSQFVRVSGNDYDSDPFVANYNSYKWHNDILTLNPDTNAQWLAAEIDAIELGWVVV